MIRRHVVQAIFRRNFVSYFSSPTGYVFISVFVALSSILAFWRPVFFTNNLANLDLLNEYFPYLLLFFVPAVAMAIWAEERKQGTDELLLTLPARDLEIVLGKYLATLGIYTVALAFSLTHVIVLLFLGSPDKGVMFGTYLGYWFLGGSLLAVAMTASLITTSQTVAFILGALFCAVPVLLGKASALGGSVFQQWIEGLGVAAAFGDLAKGVLSLRALFYFLSLAALFIYLNLVLVSQRRSGGGAMWGHYLVRWGAMLVIGIAIGVFATRAGARADLTSERLFSLTDRSREVLSKIDASRPVYIQAYISPEVPESYVLTRQTLIGLLQEYDAMGGDRVHLRILDTEKYSEEARQAEEQFGIKAERVRDFDEGRHSTDEIFLGVAFTCGADEQVIPFFYKGLSVEYEATRSIGVVSAAQRRRIGVVNTDAKLFGGFDMQAMSSQGEWQIVSELKKQYEVVPVGLQSPIVDRYDVLLVAQVSSLTQPEMNHLLAYLRQGNGAILFDDPFPAFNPRLAPNEPKGGPNRGMMMGMPPPPSEPKGDLARFLHEIGLNFPPETVVWDSWNPHKSMPFRPEILFVGSDRFNAADPVSSGLQEMALIFSGEVRARGDVPLAFTSLLTTTPMGGGVPKAEMFPQDPFSQGPRYRSRGTPLTLAARVKGTIPSAAPAPAPGQPSTPPAPGQINVVFVADLDCVSDSFFQLRQDAPEGLKFDNITFVLNCVDALAGDEAFVTLRKRRPQHRTLKKLEDLRKDDEEKRLNETKAAEEKAEQELKEAQERLNAKVDEIRKRTDIDENQKEIQLRTVEQAENKKLQVARREIEDRKKTAVEKSVATLTLAVRASQRVVMILALLLPPIPPLLIGLYVLLRRLAAQGRTV